ncbi:MAG: hypothetical protein HY872_14500 [Chloroflexi bacterium]|nr:hypothetical protein [Chloroflexota bacterium]
MLLSPAAPLHAQTAPTLAKLQIAFWPEYDRRAMLVIYQGTVAAGVPLPAQLTFSFPAAYGPPGAVAFSDAQGRLLTLEYATATVGDQLQISFSAPTTDFQFEYYDTSLDLTSSTRRYQFSASTPYAVQALVLQVQRPMGVNALTTTPPLNETLVGQDALTYQRTTVNNLAPGAPITLDLSYTKSTDTLTVNTAPTIATPDLPSTATAGGNSSVVLAAVVLGVLGVALVAGALVWYARSRSNSEEELSDIPRRPRRRKGHPPPPKPAAPTVAPAPPAAVFCHECGQAAEPADEFCRNCGTVLRR